MMPSRHTSLLQRLFLAWITLTLLQPAGNDPRQALPGLVGRATAAEAASVEAVVPPTRDSPASSAESETPKAGSPAMTDADLVIGLETALARDEETLEALQNEYDSPKNEYRQAEAALQTITKQVTELGKEVAQLEAEGKPVPEEISSALKTAQEKESLAKQRFEVAFEGRKALREKITTLNETILQAEVSLAKLTGELAPEAAPTTVSPTAAPPTAPPSTDPSQPPADEVKDPAAAQAPLLPGPVGVATAALDQNQTATNQVQAAAPEEGPVETRQLLEARDTVATKQAEAQRSEEDLSLFRERYLSRKREQEAVQKLLDTAQKQASLAAQERSVLEAELAQKSSDGAPVTELAAIQKQIDDTAQRLTQARAQAAEQLKRAEELQTLLTELEELEEAGVRAAEAKQALVRDAQNAVRFLENPFHPRNLVRWLATHGPSLLGIVVLMVIATLLIRLLNARIVRLVARTSSHGSQADRENRAETLVSVFRSSASLVVIAGGMVMILDECGVPVGPLLGGAAILGLAVAFGAQRLIGDFFHGFVMLLENQYKVNDVIRVAGIAGLVERITLRVTVLRDLEGCLHFVPNGEIKAVTNMTHGWSRALFDIGVALREDADRAMTVLMDLAQELRRDPKFSPLILDDAEMLGVDAITDSSFVIKFFIKTKPLQQWTVKREMLRRIKRRFNELGIEIPYPHRSVYLRGEGAPPAALSNHRT